VQSDSQQSQSLSVPLLVGYYVTLGIALGASLLTSYRVWGFGWWSHYSLYAVTALFALAALVPAFIARYSKGICDLLNTFGRRYTLFSLFFVVLFTTLFVLRQARTHFLGDGYTLLSRMIDGPLPSGFGNRSCTPSRTSSMRCWERPAKQLP